LYALERNQRVYPKVPVLPSGQLAVATVWLIVFAGVVDEITNAQHRQL